MKLMRNQQSWTCLAGTTVALIVEVDRDCLRVVCVEVAALFLGQGITGND